MMIHDTHLVVVWFGFVFLMLLFRLPFASHTIRTSVFHSTHDRRFPRVGTPADGRETHGRRFARV